MPWSLANYWSFSSIPSLRIVCNPLTVFFLIEIMFITILHFLYLLCISMFIECILQLFLVLLDLERDRDHTLDGIYSCGLA